jgi:hypothetical protein
MNIMEQQIWDYLDGNCSLEERKMIAHLIIIDPVYQSLYAELKAVHELIGTMELDEPSMSFTRNVMDKVVALPTTSSAPPLIDKRIIYGIAGFFLLSILALLAVVFTQIDWTKPVTEVLPEYNVPKLDFTSDLNRTYLQIFFFADVILGLYIIDSVMRKKMLNR